VFLLRYSRLSPFVIRALRSVAGAWRSRSSQVWYSSTWSRATLAAFQAVCKSLFSRPTPLCGGSFASAAAAYLGHWASVPPPSLLQARELWLAGITRTGNSIIAQFVRHKDRMAFARYHITGDLLGDASEEAAVGSLTMFALPDGAPLHEPDSNAFDAVAFKRLQDLHARMPNATVVELLEHYLLSALTLCRQRLLTRRVQVEIVAEEVTERNAAALIARRRPWAVAWSNLLDYGGYEAFHRLARLASAPSDTIHYAHSGNWVANTYGIALLDMPTEARVATVDVLHSTASFADDPRMLLAWPPFTCIDNVATPVLANQCVMQWARHFIAVGERTGFVRLALSSLADSAAIRTSSVAATLAWFYDPTVQFSLQQ
jgi:hypothetical protein